MPTGYTAELYDGKAQTFAEFAMECARNFGALISLRDSPGAEVPERFEASSYHREKLDEAEGDLRRWQEMSDEDVAADLRHVQEDTAAKRQSVIDSAQERESRYRAMLAEVEAWTPPSDNHVGLKEFMVQQLTESIRFDCSTSYLPEIQLGDPAAWREDRIAKARKDIAYHAEQYAAECERAAERTAWVQALRYSLNASTVQQ